jgi:hypothetical protein
LKNIADKARKQAAGLSTEERDDGFGVRMILYAALDVAIEKTALCIVDREGAVVLETNVASDPDAFADCLAPYHRIM